MSDKYQRFVFADLANSYARYVSLNITNNFLTVWDEETNAPVKIMDAMRHGFEDISKSSLPDAYTGTNTFTLTKIADYNVFFNGINTRITANKSIDVSLTAEWLGYSAAQRLGQWFVSMNASGSLVATKTPFDILSYTSTPVATLYYNGTEWIVGEERHGVRDLLWHSETHKNYGCAYQSGFTPTPTFTSANTFSFAGGVTSDEGLLSSTTGAQTTCRIGYRVAGGATMTWDASGTAYAKLSGGAPVYDNNGTLTTVPVSKYTVIWMFQTNRVGSTNKITAIVGQGYYDSVALAEEAPMPNLAGMSVAEWKLLYRVNVRNLGGALSFVETDNMYNITTGPVISAAAPTSISAGNVTVVPFLDITATNAQDTFIELAAKRALLAGSLTQPFSTSTLTAAGSVNITTGTNGAGVSTGLTLATGGGSVGDNVRLAFMSAAGLGALSHIECTAPGSSVSGLVYTSGGSTHAFMGGNVLIGLTAPSTGAKLEVAGSGSFTGSVGFNPPLAATSAIDIFSATPSKPTKFCGIKLANTSWFDTTEIQFYNAGLISAIVSSTGLAVTGVIGLTSDLKLNNATTNYINIEGSSANLTIRKWTGSAYSDLATVSASGLDLVGSVATTNVYINGSGWVRNNSSSYNGLYLGSTDLALYANNVGIASFTSTTISMNTDLHINSADSALRFQTSGTNKWGFINNYPSSGQLSLYDYIRNVVRATFLSGGTEFNGYLNVVRGTSAFISLSNASGATPFYIERFHSTGRVVYYASGPDASTDSYHSFYTGTSSALIESFTILRNRMTFKGNDYGTGYIFQAKTTTSPGSGSRILKFEQEETYGTSWYVKQVDGGGSTVTNDVVLNFFPDNSNANPFVSMDVANAKVTIAGKVIAKNSACSSEFYTINGSGNATTGIKGSNWTHSLSLFDSYNSSAYCVASGGYTGQSLITLNGYSAQDTINKTSYYGSDYCTVAGTVTATAFNATSSRKAKENIQPFNFSALAILKDTVIYSYNYKSDEEKTYRIGFMADDTDEMIAGENHDKFDLNNTVGMLIKAVQELSEEIEQLKRARI